MDTSDSLDRAEIITVLTTEQYVLQGARSALLTDMQGRANMFTTAVSSTLVALALVGNIAKLGDAFQAFAFVMLPTLYVFGVGTYFRIVQISVEDVLRVRGLARIRHWYRDNAPSIAPLFLTSFHDDIPGLTREMGVRPGRYQLFMATEAVVALIDSIILGAIAAMFAVLRLQLGLAAAVIAGAVCALLSIAVLMRISTRMWENIDRDHPPMFPSTP
ncbi:MAG TPA: hypothetical protein VGU66_01500 [Candidatus Elarobacter sp.]|nr:hypothetical protein [Candidatus Elarobacter sp.]